MVEHTIQPRLGNGCEPGGIAVAAGRSVAPCTVAINTSASDRAVPTRFPPAPLRAGLTTEVSHARRTGAAAHRAHDLVG